MKIASCSETLRKLYTTKFFPSPDMVAEVHWATKAETFHMKNDEKFLQKEDGVDIVPAWSVGLMMSALPNSISVCEPDDPLEAVEYQLHIFPAKSGDISRVAYINFDDELYCDTMADELTEAIVKMIDFMDESGEYNAPATI